MFSRVCCVSPAVKEIKRVISLCFIVLYYEDEKLTFPKRYAMKDPPNTTRFFFRVFVCVCLCERKREKKKMLCVCVSVCVSACRVGHHHHHHHQGGKEGDAGLVLTPRC